MLDQRRLERALLGSGDGFQQVLFLLPLLFQLNHPSLPGYVVKAPCGVAHFSLSDYQQRFLKGEYPAHYDAFKRQFYTAKPPILGLYVMGSFGSISQTSSSDMDTWICCREDLNDIQRDLLTQKARQFEEWALQFDVEIHFY